MTTQNRNQAQKLTATMLIAMAQRQGITLVEAGSSGAQPAAAGNQANESAYRGALAEVETLRRQLAETRASGAAALAESQADVSTWKGAHASVSRQVDGIAGELAESRAEIASLTRTVEKLRRTVQHAGPAASGPPTGAAEPVTRGDQVATVTGTVTGIIRFHGPQGVGTADRIKAIGGRWRFNPKRADGTPSQGGFWAMPDSPETAELIMALRFEGKLFSEE